MTRAAADHDLLRTLANEHGNALLPAEAPDQELAVAAAATLRAARQATRVIYAVAEQERVAAVAAYLSLKTGGLRLRVVGEVIDEAERVSLARADFDVLVCSVRRLAALLSAAPRMADAVGLVVIEAVDQALRAEGVAWDQALTLLRLAELPPRISGTTRAGGPAELAALRRWLGASGATGRGELQLELGAKSEVTPPPLAPIVSALLGRGAQVDEAELRRRVLTSFAGHATYEALGAGAKLRFTALLAATLEELVAAGSLRRLRGGGYTSVAASRPGRWASMSPSMMPTSGPQRSRSRPAARSMGPVQGTLAFG